MFYFDVLDIIQESPEPVTTMEIYAKIKQQRHVTYRSVKRILQNLYLKNNQVTRIQVKTETNVRSLQYAYFIIKR